MTKVSFVPMDAVGEYGELRLDRTSVLEAVRGGYTYFRDGDVIVAKITPCFENGKGAIATNLCNGIGFGSTEFFVLRPNRNLDAKFLLYITQSQNFRDRGEAEMVGAAGQKRVPPEFVDEFPIPTPPLAEQRAIAAFLDRETAKIDALIEKKLILLKKLKEWEQRTLFDAVNFEAEKAGESWPVLSVVKPGKPVMYGIVLPGAHVPNGVPIIKGGDVEAGRLEPSLLSRTEVSIDAHHSKSKVAEGDLIYAIRGSVGACRVVPSDLSGANLTQDVARISPGHDVTTEWMYLCLRSYVTFGQVEPRILGATIKGINIRDLERVRIPVPSIARQREVANRVGRELRARQQLNDRLRAQITHLREYRTALISAAVTGQIDVRGRV